MGRSLRFLRIPRPKTFFYVMSLQTGAALITLSLLLNKISGIYGLLAILTGFHLSPFQLSMYIYSVLALILTAFLAPHIRKQTPFYCLALFWFYLLDSVINAAYTAAFAVTWFLVISQHHNSAPASGPGSQTMGDTAGFKNPKYNVSAVHVAPVVGEAAAEPAPAPAGAIDGSSGKASLGNGVLQPESFQSIGVICTLWTIRVYFVLVMMAFAKQCLRQYVCLPNSRENSMGHSRNTSTVSNADFDPNPFSSRSPDGQGWKGKLGRAMISIGRGYWLSNDDEDNSWMVGLNRKFNRNRESTHPSERGLSERERRRRSGTGPPVPSPAILEQIALQGGVSPDSNKSAQPKLGIQLPKSGMGEGNTW